MRTIRIAFLFAICIVTLTLNVLTQDEVVTDRYDDTFRKYTQRFFGPGYDWRIFKAQAMAESNIDMKARSWCGARGIMQLMPSTFAEIRSKNPEIGMFDKPEWNIAAGILYDSYLWEQWAELGDRLDRGRFTLASYNAGRGTLLRARGLAEAMPLDPNTWMNIQIVAPNVSRWRYDETLTYVDKIEAFAMQMDENGRLVPLEP